MQLFPDRSVLEIDRLARVFLERLTKKENGATIGFDPEFEERKVLVRIAHMELMRRQVQRTLDEANALHIDAE